MAKPFTAAMIGLSMSRLRVMPPNPGPSVKRCRNSGAGRDAKSIV
jgi:hypothetical protein